MPHAVRISWRWADATAGASRRLETAVNTAAVLFAVVIAVISLGYTFLAYPQADDLERTGAMRVFSPLERIRSDYHSIDGRWASKLVEYLCYTGEHVLDRYPIILMVVLLIGVIGCCCAVAIISGYRISERSVIAGGIVSYSFLWLSVPHGEPFYWFPAGAEDWLPIALGMILLWLLYNFTGWWSRIIVVAMAFVVPPLHEVGGSWIVPVLAVTWLVWRAEGKPGSGTAAAAAFAGILGTASDVLAPGVRARAAGTPHQSLPDAFQHAMQIEAILFAHWVVLALVLIVILLTVARMKVRPSWCEKPSVFVRTCLVVAIAPLPILMLTMISYALGGGIPRRLIDAFYFLMVPAVAAFTAVCGVYLARWGATKAFLTEWGALLRSVVVILALVGVMSLPRFRAAFEDIEPAIRNHAVWEQRTADVWAKRNSGARDVVVNERMLPLSILPFYFDLTEDPNFYVNQHMRTYFGLESIRLSSPSQMELAGDHRDLAAEAKADAEMDSEPIRRAPPPSFVEFETVNVERKASLERLWRFYLSRSDLQKAFDPASAGFTTNLVTWAYGATRGDSPEPRLRKFEKDYLSLLPETLAIGKPVREPPAAYAAFIIGRPAMKRALDQLWRLYLTRSDLQKAFPEDSASFTRDLFVWASGAAKGSSSDPYIAKFSDEYAAAASELTKSK